MKKAFSLVELMVVLAISAVILSIIIIPLVQSFNFTRQAEGLAGEQERARILINQIASDISNSSAVNDCMGRNGAQDIFVPGQNGSLEMITLQNCKIDILRPAEGENTTPGVFVDPNTNHIDPTLGAPKGQPLIPAAPGQTYVRYFIGLKRPLAPDGLSAGLYNNPYDGYLMKVNANQDNLFVVYRAEYHPFKYAGGQVVPNTDLFNTLPGNPNMPDLGDPDFFTQDPSLTGAAQQQRASQIQHWLQISKVVTEDTRYDSILPVLKNKFTGTVFYDGNVPRLVSLIQFRPTTISQEPATGQAAVALGDEADFPFNPGDPEAGPAPDVFRTKKGAWSSAVIIASPYVSSTVNANQAGSDTLTLDLKAQDQSLPGYQQLVLQSANANVPAGLHMFDLAAYNTAKSQNTTATPHYPFSEAVLSASNYDVNNGLSDWLTQPQNVRDEFIPFTPNMHSGEVITSIGLDEVGNPIAGTKNADNTPLVNTCGSDGLAWTPQTDPNVAGGNFYDTTFNSVNERYNKVYTQFPALRQIVRRFIDLRVTPQRDAWANPADPAPDGTIRMPWIPGWTGFDNFTIVPGSEIITGPDMTPGSPNYGQQVRYTRVTQDPGPNQYTINYTNQLEPQDYTQIDPSLPNPPGTYDATLQSYPASGYDSTNISSLVIEPRFKVGYVEFESDPNMPLPSGQIHVYYRFKFNRPGDTLSVDYDSREAISVLLTMHAYPDTTLPSPQTITLEATAPVRNFLR